MTLDESNVFVELCLLLQREVLKFYAEADVEGVVGDLADEGVGTKVTELEFDIDAVAVVDLAFGEDVAAGAADVVHRAVPAAGRTFPLYIETYAVPAVTPAVAAFSSFDQEHTLGVFTSVRGRC